MSRDFSIGVRFIGHMGFLETISFLGEGVGAALYLFAIAGGLLPVAALGWLFVVMAVLALLAHLGQPLRAWRALARPGSAWVSRGVLVIGGFTGSAGAALLAHFIGVLQPLEQPLTLLATAFAVPVILYAGMLLRSMRAIRLWRGPFVPLAFCSHSLASGALLALALGTAITGDPARIGWMRECALVALVACALLSLLHLARAERSTGVRASIDRLSGGDLRGRLVWGAGVCGIAAPLVALLVAGPDTPASSSAVVLLGAAVARLAGDYAYRSAIVLAGAYEPVVPALPIRSAQPAARW